MHCASCASTIEKALRKQPGVQAAEVNFGTESAKVAFDAKVTGPGALAKAVEPLGYTLVVPAPAAPQHDHGSARHDQKDGKRDLEKAIHYIQMLIEMEYPECPEIPAPLDAQPQP